jgi:hypothetical protein
MTRRDLALGGLLRDALLEGEVAAPEGTFDPVPDRFKFLRKIGQGGWGSVWVARDANLGRLVAVKLIASERTELATQILRNEGAQLARLRPHPNVVQVYSWENLGQLCFVVLQFVGGGSLRDMLQTFGPLSWSRAARYVADTADGLARVHEHGLLHRDIKPDNLLLDAEQDQVLLTDFGFAGTPAEMQFPVGTPGYAAPEALYQSAVAASDVYSLGATFYDLVAGQPPFQGPSVAAVVAAASTGEPPPLPPKVLPERLMNLVRASLAPEPAARPTLRQFHDELRGETARFTTDALFGSRHEGASVAARPTVSLRVHRLGQNGPVEVRPIDGATRDLVYAGYAPPMICLRDGDSIRLTVNAGASGYLFLLNLGPTGNLTVLVPNADLGEGRIAPGQPLVFPPIDGGHIEVRPPGGVERIIALWTRSKPAFDPVALFERWVAKEARPEHPSGYLATRQLVYVAKGINDLAADDVAWCVVAVDHQSGTSA